MLGIFSSSSRTKRCTFPRDVAFKTYSDPQRCCRQFRELLRRCDAISPGSSFITIPILFVPHHQAITSFGPLRALELATCVITISPKMVGIGKQAAKYLEDDLRESCRNAKSGRGDFKISLYQSELHATQSPVYNAECLYLGRFLETIRRDVHQAGSVYRSSCDAGHGESCFQYAQLLHTGKTGFVDHRQAYDYNQKGCKLGCSKACLSAGLANVTGNRRKAGVGIDYRAAANFLERACDLDDGLGCYLLAGMYLTGVGDVEPDTKLALKYDFQGCQLGFSLACSNFLGNPTAQSKSSNGLLWRLEQIKP